MLSAAIHILLDEQACLHLRLVWIDWKHRELFSFEPSDQIQTVLSHRDKKINASVLGNGHKQGNHEECKQINFSWLHNGAQREINKNNDAEKAEHCGFLLFSYQSVCGGARKRLTMKKR